MLGDNGIISKAKEARDKYAQAEENDQASLGEAGDWIDKQVGGNGDDGVKLDKNLPSGTGKTPYFPGNDFSHVVGTDLSNGLVIFQNARPEVCSTFNKKYLWFMSKERIKRNNS